MSFVAKVILITGAGSGIGADATHHFAKQKANVAMIDFNEENLNRVADQIVNDGLNQPLRIVADVTIDAERIINETVDHFGRLDVLVNCAGTTKLGTFNDFNVTDFDRIMNVNVRATMLLAHSAIPHLTRTKGNIVNVSSIYACTPLIHSINYSISKAAIDQFTKCAALTLAPNGIRVNAIAPGFIRTNIYSVAGLTNAQTDQMFDAVKANGVLVGNVNDTSEAIAYLAAQPFTTGTILLVDGGFSCARISEQMILPK